MSQNKQTIEELLSSMLTLPTPGALKDKLLPNSVETWERIGNNDGFSELNFSTEDEKTEFLKEWTADNPYSSI